ncbi:MAG: hypothetical protein HC828_02890 [Blastochloris sp.]|nr:hypothetical protein [Blastochloris sp.]
MQAVYPNTPEHQLAQHIKADGFTPNFMRALGLVLKDEIQINKKGRKEEEVIRNGLAGLGLVKLIRTDEVYEIFNITEPGGDRFNSQKVWQLYTSYLSKPKSWASLLDVLRQEPYGMYDSLLAAFTAAFFTFQADSIEITTSSGQPSVLDEKVLKQLIETPKSYNVRLQPLSDAEKQWLRGVVSNGLRKQADSGAGQGKTLRARVASQVKTWLTGLKLPVFAEKLSVAQIAALLPDIPEPIVNAAVTLLQTPRSDEAIAGILLKEIPANLGAPERSEWTQESVKDLITLWSETCRSLERLPKELVLHATRSVAAVFGSEGDVEDSWDAIFRWRLNRQILQNQTSTMSSNTREFFRLTSPVSGTIRQAFLDEFAKTLPGVYAAYQTWPTLDHLDRLVKEIQKARDEIDTRWRAIASAEDVWHDGLATAALGRPMTGVKAEKAAIYLYEWTTSITWPACAINLQPSELKNLYPDLPEQACTDISAILKRTQHLAEDWKRELDDGLPKQFAITGWTKAEVEKAIARIKEALKHAANLDALLRKHVQQQVLPLFCKESIDTATPKEILHRWREANPIPAENDLDTDAQIILGQIDSNSDAETTLLITLPRALPSIEQSYQQWRSYADLTRYTKTVAAAIDAIARYTPLTAAEQEWLTGIVRVALRRPLINPPREKNQLACSVGEHMAEWLREQNLPRFVVTLTRIEICDLLPEASPSQIAAVNEILSANTRLTNEPAQLLLIDIPNLLGYPASEGLGDESVEGMLIEFTEIFRLISSLPFALSRHLFAEIGSVFGIDTTDDGPNTLVAKLRTWRQSFVLFANESLSPDATLLSDALSAPADDPLYLLQYTLPSKLKEVREPYGNWNTWEQRAVYRQSLAKAAEEIKQIGRVSDATPEVQKIWEEMRTKITNLSRDEQRWLIKAFSEEFRA